MKVTTVRNGCPICQGDIKGNSDLKYLCAKCNIYFEQELILYNCDDDEKKRILSEIKEKKVDFKIL